MSAWNAGWWRGSRAWVVWCLALAALPPVAGALPGPPDAPAPPASTARPPAVLRPAPVMPGIGRAKGVAALKLTSKEEERELLNQLGHRRQVMDDSLVLRRLAEEKRRELARLVEELEEEFGVRPDRNYRYDPAARRLYEVSPEGAADAPSEGGPVRTFDSDEQGARFSARIARKRLLVDALAVLELLLTEKLDELKVYDSLMTERYALSPEKAYRYERATMELFEADAPERRP